MNRLTAEQLLTLNRKITGNTDAVTDKKRRLLVQIADLPYERDGMHAYRYRDVFSRATVLGCALMREKPFCEGNEKTAILTVMTMLELNGYAVEDTPASIETLYRLLMTEDTEACRTWLETHIIEEGTITR